MDKQKVILLCNNPSITCLSVFKSLRKEKVPVEVILNNLEGPFIYSKFAKYKHNNENDPEKYLNFILNQCKKKDDPILWPISDDTVKFISKNKTILEEKYVVPVPKWEIIQKCVNKNKTYEEAKKIGVPTPITYKVSTLDQIEEISRKIKFPCIIKPDSTEIKKRIGKVVKIIDNKFELSTTLTEFITKEWIPLNVQEIIPGPSSNLYTVGSVMDYNLKPSAIFTGRKIRQKPIDFGTCTLGESKWTPEIADLGIKLLKKIGYFGVSQVEFKFDPRDRTYKLMEINARPWLWIWLPTFCGMNLPYIFYKTIKDQESTVGKFEEGLYWHRVQSDIVLLSQQIINPHPWFSFKDTLKYMFKRKTYPLFSIYDIKPFLYETYRLFFK